MQKLQRFKDWQDRLSTYIDRCREEPFRWGGHDCGMFAGGAINAITGTDFRPEFEGAYSDRKEAAQFLRSKKWRTLREACSRHLGKSVHPAHAGKGDIVQHKKALGVCVGRFSWFVGEEPAVILEDGTPIMRTGLVHVPTLQCTYAWKVG